ncbi:MAG: V-type ATPase subunit, partial [Candidatus Methanomethylicia archaeon]|nr:V-type ATPase subunit [Candidatus Methanomethylicia archaeon]
GLEKAEGLRDIERIYEKRIFKNLQRIYYAGYVEAGSVIGYLELKLTEVKNLIRIANAIERGIDPKRALQDFAVY